MRIFSRRRHSGFTLLEGVFSIFLTFLVLGSLAYTLKQAGEVKSNTKNMDHATEVNHALVLMKADLKAADTVSPSSGSATSISLTRIDPGLTFKQRIGHGDKDPFEADEHIGIEYSLQSGILIRSVIPNRGPRLAQRLLRADRFQVNRTGSPDLLEATLEIGYERVSKTYTMKVALK